MNDPVHYVRHFASWYVFSRAYIGGNSTNIGFVKRVPIPFETIGM